MAMKEKKTIKLFKNVVCLILLSISIESPTMSGQAFVLASVLRIDLSSVMKDQSDDEAGYCCLWD